MPQVTATPPKSSIYHYASEVPPHPRWCLYYVIKQIRFSFQTGRGSSWLLCKSFTLPGAPET